MLTVVALITIVSLLVGAQTGLVLWFLPCLVSALASAVYGWQQGSTDLLLASGVWAIFWGFMLWDKWPVTRKMSPVGSELLLPTVCIRKGDTPLLFTLAKKCGQEEYEGRLLGFPDIPTARGTLEEVTAALDAAAAEAANKLIQECQMVGREHGYEQLIPKYTFDELLRIYASASRLTLRQLPQGGCLVSLLELDDEPQGQ